MADDDAVQKVVEGIDAIVYLAMGVKFTDHAEVQDIDLAFDVNVRGTYRFLRFGLAAGVSRFVYASTLSVYERRRDHLPVDESDPPDAWAPYGISKRLGEHLCEAAAQQYPAASLVALRLLQPRSEATFPGHEYQRGNPFTYGLGPNDTRRLFLAAIDCNTPGAHIVQTTGDLEGYAYPHDRVTQLLGWSPQGD